MESPLDTDVLIAGAGPTGLVLALYLAQFGVRVRIVDKTAEPGTTSRALAVQARTLEFYDQIGLGQTVAARGRQVKAVNLWVEGRQKARAVFGEIGKGISPFSFALIFPQDEHEKLLIERLSGLGIQVERDTGVAGFTETPEGVQARLSGPAGEQRLTAAYIAGCDGAHSTVRTQLNIGFPGGTYEHVFYVADVSGSGDIANGDIHVEFDRADFLAIFPLKGEGRVRLVGTVRPDAGDPQSLTWEDVSHTPIERMGLTIDRVNWFSTYRVHHRVAHAFRGGRAFLAGDAAHIHSPVGGQGMNTGIGDAVNLAWKLAAVIQRRAAPALLDTYEPERIAFARRLVATTDASFIGVTSTSTWARFFRMRLMPAFMPLLFTVPAMRRFLFRTVSQTAITYRGSGISEGGAGRVQAGDRLPWAGDNFAPLQSLDWQVHVYGEGAGARGICEARRIALHAFGWTDRARAAGLARDALYLVRPDGYVGFAAAAGDTASLTAYLDRHAIRPRTPPATA